MQVGRTHTVSSLGLLAKGVVGLPGRTHHLHHAHHKNRHFYFLQPSSVLVETFKPGISDPPAASACTEPLATACRPASAARSVLFPQPDGPSRTTHSPARTCRSIGPSASKLPNRTQACCALNRMGDSLGIRTFAAKSLGRRPTPNSGLSDKRPPRS